jgi:hypothetical protein
MYFSALRTLTALVVLSLPACNSKTLKPPAPHEPKLTEAAVAMPIAEGETDDWRALLEDLVGPRYDEYASSRERFGITSQTTFLQQTPMGDFAIIHLTGPDLNDSIHRMSQSTDPWDLEWREITSSLHGVDFNDEDELNPGVEALFSMGSPTPDSLPFAFLIPIVPGAADGLREIAQEIAGDQREAYAAAREAAGIDQEQVYLQQTAIGDALVVYWRAEDPGSSLQAVLGSEEPFDTWFRPPMDTYHALPLEDLVSIVSNNEEIARYPHP